MTPNLHDLELLLRSDKPIVLIEHSSWLVMDWRLPPELASTQPLSVIMDTQIQALRAWASERTVPAHGHDSTDGQ